eukprot:6456363-Amphidinium_carterae.1
MGTPKLRVPAWRKLLLNAYFVGLVHSLWHRSSTFTLRDFVAWSDIRLATQLVSLPSLLQDGLCKALVNDSLLIVTILGLLNAVHIRTLNDASRITLDDGFIKCKPLGTCSPHPSHPLTIPAELKLRRVAEHQLKNFEPCLGPPKPAGKMERQKKRQNKLLKNRSLWGGPNMWHANLPSIELPYRCVHWRPSCSL